MTDEHPAAATVSAAVLVVNWNGARLLTECLDSLAAVLPAHVEVVVVDNASTDGSPDVVAAHPRVTRVVRRASNDGFGAGVNAGAASTGADVLVLLNNDAVAEPGWFEALTAPLLAPGADDVGAVTGHVLLDGWFVPVDRPKPGDLRDAAGRAWRRATPDAPGASQRVNSTGNEVTRRGNGRDRDWLAPADDVRAATEVFGFNGGCAALRRAAFEDVGGFDESIFLYYEDTDLSWRLRRRGWRVVYACDAVTTHRHAASSGVDSPRFHVQNAANRLRVAVRNAPWSVVAVAWARSVARLAGPRRRDQATALADALRHLAADLRVRRAVDRTARVPRREVATLLVPERPGVAA